ncbi:MAG TPA: hypothetical protein VFP14_04190, partial [Novosphingobium sp.]|nr:hypothetical protein [Novosphingobium sp.]
MAMRSAIIGAAAAGGLALALGGCGKGGEAGKTEGDALVEASPGAAGAAPAAAAASSGGAPASFAQCAACHSTVPGKHGIGPNLAGVYGTKAGEIPGYTFSPALKASGLTWDDATLDKWLAGPMKLVPGTKMT